MKEFRIKELLFESEKEAAQRMEHLNKRKPNLLFFWFLLPFVLYGGYAVGTLEGTKINISNMRDLFLYSHNKSSGSNGLSWQN